MNLSPKNTLGWDGGRDSLSFSESLLKHEAALKVQAESFKDEALAPIAIQPDSLNLTLHNEREPHFHTRKPES